MSTEDYIVCHCGSTIEIEYDHNTRMFFVECFDCGYEEESKSRIDLDNKVKDFQKKSNGMKAFTVGEYENR